MENASKFIKMAFDANIHVPKYLLDLEIIEEIPSKYEVGDEGEAMNYYEMTSNTWISVDKSLYWILDEYFDYMKKNKIKTDFKKKDGYKQSIILSNKYNLYRQDYCGCKYSVRNWQKILILYKFNDIIK